MIKHREGGALDFEITVPMGSKCEYWIHEDFIEIKIMKEKKYTLELVNPNDIPYRNNCIIREGSDLTEEELKICEDALNKYNDSLKQC